VRTSGGGGGGETEEWQCWSRTTYSTLGIFETESRVQSLLASSVGPYEGTVNKIPVKTNHGMARHGIIWHMVAQ
jgi:hypothetical protein